MDNILRPDKVWLHKLGYDQTEDICLYHEKDDTFSLGLQASESKQYLFVGCGSKNTSFIFYLDISKQNKELVVLTPRVYGVDTNASHRGNHFYIKRRSDEFYNSELVACPLDNVAETTVLLPHRERVKIQDFQLFENHIAKYERENGLPKVTVYLLPATGGSVGQLEGGRGIDFVDPAYAVEPEESQFHSSVIRFHYSSMRTPPSVFDYDMDSGVSVLKKTDTMKSPEVKKESQSEDIKPADPSVHSLSSKEPLVQATLSSLFKKEEKKRYTRSPKRSPATKGPAAKKQRASPKETQPAGKSKVSGTRKKQKPKVEEDEIEQLPSSSQHGAAADCDFKGGAGSTCDEPIGGHRPGKGITEPLSPKFESAGHTSEDSDHMDENGTQTTSEAPSVRQSARTVGKKALNAHTVHTDAGEKPSPAAAESSSWQQDSQWLAALSEPELDLLISLKELAATRAKNAGHPRLADKFDLRTLRALVIVLLQNFKEELKETSVDPSIFDRFALLNDSDAGFTNSGSDSGMVRPNEDQQTPFGWHEEVAQSQKKGKMSERR